MANIFWNTPAEQLRTFFLYCQPQRNLYNGTYSKADWGGRGGWALKTEVLNRNFFLTPGLIL